METDLKNVLEENIKQTLQSLGKNLSEGRQQLQTFLLAIEAEVEEAVMNEDVVSLQFIRDRIALKTGDLALDLAESESRVVVSGIIGILHAVIALAL